MKGETGRTGWEEDDKKEVTGKGKGKEEGVRGGEGEEIVD